MAKCDLTDTESKGLSCPGLAEFSPDGMQNAIDELRPADQASMAAPEGVKIPAKFSSGPLYSFFELPAPLQKLPEPKRVCSSLLPHACPATLACNPP